jgi:hypothetical protein
MPRDPPPCSARALPTLLLRPVHAIPIAALRMAIVKCEAWFRIQSPCGPTCKKRNLSRIVAAETRHAARSDTKRTKLTKITKKAN